jgi:hypothetical protein
MPCFRFMFSLFMCMKLCVVYLPHSSTQLTRVSCEFAPSVLFIYVYLKLLRADSIVSGPGVSEIFKKSKNSSHTSNPSPVSPLQCLSTLSFCYFCFIIHRHTQLPKDVKKFPSHYSYACSTQSFK